MRNHNGAPAALNTTYTPTLTLADVTPPKEIVRLITHEHFVSLSKRE